MISLSETSIFLSPLDLDINSESPPAQSLQLHSLTTQESNRRRIESRMQFYNDLINKLRHLILARSSPDKKRPSILIIILSGNHFRGVPDLKPIIAILFQICYPRFYELGVECLHLFVSLSEEDFVLLGELFTTKWATFVLVEVCGFVYAGLAEDVAAVFQHCRSIQDIEANRAFVVLVVRLASRDHCIRLYSEWKDKNNNIINSEHNLKPLINITDSPPPSSPNICF